MSNKIFKNFVINWKNKQEIVGWKINESFLSNKAPTNFVVSRSHF